MAVSQCNFNVFTKYFLMNIVQNKNIPMKYAKIFFCFLQYI